MEESTQQKVLASAVRRYRRLRMLECFDPIDLESRPTPVQQDVLESVHKIQYRYVVAGNQSGKSQLGAREVAWIFEDNHPFWSRPARWGEEPLVMLVIGRTTKQVEEVLWRKISAFLNPSEYKTVSVGNTLQKVINTRNGNTIIFASHHADNEAREKLQAYVAHYVWIDEMPKSLALVEELHRRCQSRRGYFLATFTPKVRNDGIRKLVDASEPPHSRKWKMAMFDNPVLTEEDKEAILKTLEPHSESVRRTGLYGDWSAGEEAVYEFDGDVHVREPGPSYSPAWRHVESVDPAMSGKLGLTVWAENPDTGVWYCVQDEYITGCKAPSELVDRVQQRVKGRNIVRRVYDPHEPWYAGAAHIKGYTYMGVYNKSQRKHDLIKNLQTALGTKIFVAPWCDNLIDEFVSCRWSETADNKIVNGSKYHLLDSAQYFVDLIPPAEIKQQYITHDEWLREANKERKKREYDEQQRAKSKRKTWRIARRRAW